MNTRRMLSIPVAVLAAGLLAARPAGDRADPGPAVPGGTADTPHVAPPHTEPAAIPPHTAPHPPPADAPDTLPLDTPAARGPR
jgi:hypothetical protein